MKEKILFILVLSIFLSLALMGLGKSKADDSYFLCFTSICLPAPPVYKARNENDIGPICLLLLGKSTDRGEVKGPGFDEEEDEDDEPEEPEEDDAKVFIG